MNQVSPPGPELTRAEHAERTSAYLRAGMERASKLDNRGPVRFGADGSLQPHILEAYRKYGFYVFQGVVGEAELEEIRHAVDTMIEGAPVRPGAGLDRHGRPAFGRDYGYQPFTMVRPLSDPWGGKAMLAGRHPHRMVQPQPDADAPEYVVFLIAGMCQAMPAALRLYGHPHLLAVAEAINGPDFVPYNDAIFVKQAGVGASVAWHQDGVTHWQSPDWDEGIHGFNFQLQLYPTTPANCLWVVPGTHKQGRVDIRRKVAENGGDEKLPDAVPLVCEPGDVTIVNRQVLHGSFANSSPDKRISIAMGFHRRQSVLGQRGKLYMSPFLVYNEQRIFDRSAVIQVAIDARRQHFPEETPFCYQPFAGQEDRFRYNDETYDRVIRNYIVKDLPI